ncbi:MAG: hypothetical protein O3A00_08835 [Planctomycetota bacterium]|nr:hypothetical protein [Planctomycetota bacterium]
MKQRIVIGGFAGAVVYFIWGNLVWMVLPLHTPTLSGLPNETAISEALKSQSLETSVYMVPWSDNEADWADPDSDWAKRHEAGPVYTIIYKKEGAVPMPPSVMLTGFALDLIMALLAAVLLSCTLGCCGKCYVRRVGFVAGLGVFVAFAAHASYWNWMHFPLDYTLAFMVDVSVGWTLAGLVLAAIVKPVPQIGGAGESCEPKA